MPRSYSVGEFADELGVHVQTVKRWCRDGDLDYTRTPGGYRRIPQRELHRLAGTARPSDRIALYTRVSSHGQKDSGDLNRQRDRLTKYAHDRGWSVENTYSDVGSGLNEDRRGLQSLLDDVQDAEYGRILVTYEDRLTRFGFSYLERYFDCYGVPSQSPRTKPTNRHMKNSLTTSSNSLRASAASSMGCVPARNSR